MSDLSPLSTLAEKINAAHDEAFDHAKAALRRAADVGELLAEAKALVNHGEWTPWVQANCRFGVRQAQKYLRAFENWAAIEAALTANANSDSLLTIDSALALIAEPTTKTAMTREKAMELDAKADHHMQQIVEGLAEAVEGTTKAREAGRLDEWFGDLDDAERTALLHWADHPEDMSLMEALKRFPTFFGDSGPRMVELLTSPD